MSDGEGRTGTIETQVPARLDALREQGSANRRELSRRVGGRYWGSGRFQEALREGIAEGHVKRVSRGEFAAGTASRPEVGSSRGR